MRAKALFSLIGKSWILIVLVMSFTLVNQFLYSAFPLLTQYVLQRLSLIEGTDSSGLEIGNINLPAFLLNFFDSIEDINSIVYLVSLFLFSFFVFRVFVRFLEFIGREYLLEQVSLNSRNKLYKHIIDLPFSYHNSVDTGDLIQRVTTDVSTTSDFLAMRLIDFVRLLGAIIFGSYQLYFISPTICFGLLLLSIPVGIASVIYFLKVTKIDEEIEETESKMINVIQENVQGVRVVKAFGNEEYEINKMIKYNSIYRKSDIRSTNIMALFWPLTDIYSTSQFLLLVIVGTISIQNGTLTAFDVITATTIAGMLIYPIKSLGRLITVYTRAIVSAARLQELFSTKDEYVINGTTTPPIDGDIEFKNVSFSYQDSSLNLINNISFKIKKNETVAFIGKTGCGKSTIINLLLRMYEISGGTISIGGIDIRDIEKHYLRKNIGVVFQDPFLFGTTIKENIGITDENLTMEEIVRASVDAKFHEETSKFVLGYDTLVGEKGTSLSGGEKQRIAIARILVSKRPIIIFDDALSAVDTSTDYLIRQTILSKNLKKTSLIITHRITTAKEADKIIVLDNGNIQDIGTHDELILRGGLYSALWAIQGKLEKEFDELLEEKGGDL
ncbi:MAG: ABC transporter ATP-binding protein/permease [Acholeplasmatales bacterium]|jgi:ATP-binding cassette subfamily B protein|nr:ABC transporter ATP-binding protein/permease [Acholeplasmatales bacterium]